MREGELLGYIYERSRGLGVADPSIVVGPGDDCAVVRTASGETLLLTVDQLVEGRHFASGTSVDLIGRKAVARSVSDIAAMAGRCRWGLATGVLPARFAGGDALFDAMATWARHWGCPLVGGDIATWGRSGDGTLVLTVTVLGELPSARSPVLRSGARPGDGVYVTGALGGSLVSGRHLTFEPRVAEAAALAVVLGDRLHAMMDVSDGLGVDAGRMAAASGARIEIEAGRVPLHGDVSSWREGVGDGEDYELVFAASGDVPREVAGTRVSRVGMVTAGNGCVVIAEGGRVVDVSGMGWEHGA